jgi:hypothetical protein
MISTLLFLLVTFLAAPADLPELRKQYYASVNDSKVADQLYDKLKSRSHADPLTLAYFGAIQAVRAKHAFNPYHKVSYLKKGIADLNTAVGKNPDDLEIRFLRFSLQHYVPAFLGMSKHLDQDRVAIVSLMKAKRYGTVDAELRKALVSFMKESKRCSAAEITTLEQAL